MSITNNVPIITLEEHFLSQHVRDYYAAQGEPDRHDGVMSMVTAALMEFGPKRLKAMDDAGISLQVVSHVPSSIPLPPEVCIKVNDELHNLITQAPKGRFKGFATLPMAQPEAAAAELRRCVTTYGFLGTLIDGNCRGRFYDDEFFWPVFEAAEALDVPVYLHPAPNKRFKELMCNGNYDDAVAESLSQYAFGWHSTTALTFLRLYASGLFSKHPRLKLLLGHMGEMLPFQLDRIITVVERQWPPQTRSLREVWDENLWITTSGMFSLAPMACVLRQCRSDRIMFSVDYPIGRNEVGVEFLRRLRGEGMVSEEVLGRIMGGNAEEVLNISLK